VRGWLIFSQSRQANFSRTISITFHWRGTDSSVRVTFTELTQAIADTALASRWWINHHPFVWQMIREGPALGALAGKSSHRRRLGYGPFSRQFVPGLGRLEDRDAVLSSFRRLSGYQRSPSGPGSGAAP
jgi:hypothetical protein